MVFPDEFSELHELPTFVGHVENKTVRAGNSVILTCQVRNLGNYKVSFIYRIFSICFYLTTYI